MFDVRPGLERVTLTKTDYRLRTDGYFDSCKVSLLSYKNEFYILESTQALRSDILLLLVYFLHTT